MATAQRVGRAVVAALIVALGVAAPVAAYTLWGWYNTSAIDTDLNGQADLSVCFATSTSSPIYVNRGQVEEEMERWHGASVGGFTLNGICDSDGSSIQILPLNLGHCEAQDHGIIQMTLGWTNHPGNLGIRRLRST